ncbi:transcriptional activator RfaH [bacterium]|nr:transcriptional activator RfaH [bacterium]
MKRWLTVWTKPRQESRAETNLLRQGFDVFCPMLKERRRRGDGLRWVTSPLFPRYLFVEVDPFVQSIAPIRSSFGCVDVVRIGGEPAAVPDAVIGGLRRHAGPLERDNAWACGQELEVAGGPLRGMKAIFEARSSRDRVDVLLVMLGQWRNTTLFESDLVALA